MRSPFVRFLCNRIFRLCLLFACAGSVVLALPAFAADGVGNVIFIKPGAYVLRGGQRLPLEQKSRIEQKDTLVTDQTGKLQVIFDDDTTVALAPNTLLVVETVIPEGTPRFKTHISKGLARFITGKIVEKNPEGFEISTPQGTVGIRGTMVGVETDGSITSTHHISGSAILTFGGAVIPAGSTGTIGPSGGRPEVAPMSESTRMRIMDNTSGGLSSGTTGGASHYKGSGQYDGASISEDGTSGSDGSIVLDSVNASLFGALSGPPLMGHFNDSIRAPFITSALKGEVTGNFGLASSASASLNFGFTANLVQGSVSNGWINGNGSDMGKLNYVQANGHISSKDFHVSGFTSQNAQHDPTGTYLNGQIETQGNSLTITGMNGYIQNGTHSASVRFTQGNAVFVLH